MPYPVAASRGGKAPSVAILSPLLTGLIAYWKMDEASGNIVDLVSGLDMTAANAPDSASGKLYPTARQLSRASSQYFQRSGANALSAIVGSLSVAWWEYPTAYTGITGNYNSIIGTSSIPWYGGWSVIHTHDGSIVWYLCDVLGPDYWWTEHTGRIPTLNAWNFSVFTYDSSNGAITYRLNATPELTYSWSTGSLKAMTNLGAGLPSIGKAPHPTVINHCYDGRIGPVMVWSRSLSAEERSDLYNAGAGLAYPF